MNTPRDATKEHATRCCVACGNLYTGPLECPECGEPGEPLPAPVDADMADE